MVELPSVTLVVIGRDEEKNLEHTFRAIESIDYPKEKLQVIYVDSNSTDRSVEIARQHADAVFIEDHPLPSAARGRNRGLVEARHGIVHFIDGDVQVNRSYLKKAVEILSNPEIQAVSGVIRERSFQGWNRLVSACWAAPKEGFAGSTATGGTFMREALLQVDGYDERLTLGEETELGERFRGAGFTIWSTLQEMGVHDYGIHSFWAFLRFLYKDGRMKTRTMRIRSGSRYFSDNRRKAWSNVIQNSIGFVIVLVIILSRQAVWLPFLLVTIVMLLLVKYLLVKRIKRLHALAFFLLTNLFKPIVLAGQAAEWLLILSDPELSRGLRAVKADLQTRL